MTKSKLITHLTTGYEESYSDRGTGADKDCSVWRPRLLEGYYRLTYTATNSRSAPKHQCVIVKENEKHTSGVPALAAPRHFTCVWTDEGTGGDKDGQLWRAVPPDGYRALSDVAKHMSNSNISPGTTKSASTIDSKFMCVRDDLCEVAELSDCNWTDGGSGGRYDGATWTIKGSNGMIASHGGGDTPSFTQYRLKDFVGTLLKNMKLEVSFSNATDEWQADATYEIQTGFESKNKMSKTLEDSMKAIIAAEIKGGIEGIGSASVSTELETFMKNTTTNEMSSGVTSTEKITIPVKRPPKTTVELWSLIIENDDVKGLGGFTVTTKKYTTKSTPVDG